MINATIAERFPMLRDALKSVLQLELGVELSYWEAFPEEKNWPHLGNVDVLILDSLFFADKSAKICRQFRSQFPHLKIIILDAAPNPKEIKRFLDSDIQGYLPKSAAKSQFLECFDAVCQGEKYIHSCIQAILMEHLIHPNQRWKTNNKLTCREKEILQFIVDEYTTKEIAEKLSVSACTIETHRLHLIQKLGVKNTAGLVRVAMQSQLYGYS